MKLSNLAHVGELSKSLDYLQSVRTALNGPKQARVVVEGISLRPGIASQVVNAIEVAVDAEAAKIRDALADLGVTV